MALSAGIGLIQLTAPTWEPVVPADMVNHSRIQSADIDNGVVSALILAAREYVETATRRQIAQAQYQLLLEEFPGRQVDDYRPPTWRYGIIRFPLAPLVSVDLIQYVDPTQQTPPFVYTVLASTQYQYDNTREPGLCAPAPYLVWPVTNPLVFQAIQVNFTCGYASVDLVPARLKMAIKLLAAHLYEHREASTEKALTMIPAGLQAFISAGGYHEYV